MILSPDIMAAILLFTVTQAVVCKLHSFYLHSHPHDYKNRKFHRSCFVYNTCVYDLTMDAHTHAP